MYSFINRHLVMPLLEHRDHLSTRRQYGFLLESQRWSIERLREFQLNQLRILLSHAYCNTSFYRKMFDHNGIKPEDIRAIEDLKMLPTVTREDLNQSLEIMIAQNLSRHEIHMDSTGGSTGLSTHFARDNKCLSIKLASEYRFNSWAGWQPGEKILYYWPALKDFSKSYKQPSVLKQRLFSRALRLYGGRINEDVLEGHLEALVSFRPHLIRAFPSSLQIFAEYVQGKAKCFKIPRGIVCVGEPLTDQQRTLFKEVFDCEVFNCYVSRECGNTACECEAHRGLHISDELLLVEIESAKPGDVGKIIITDLHNMGMPLIRYDIQDASMVFSGECACGRNLTRIDLTAARLTDYFVSPVDRSMISGSTLVHYLLAEAPKVGRFQVTQDELTHISVKMVGTYEANRQGIKHIKEMIGGIFGKEMKVDVDFVDSIPFLPSGKYQFAARTFPLE